MSESLSFAELITSMMRDGVADRVSGTVRVRTVDPIDPDVLVPQDITIVHDTYGAMVVHEFGYRIMRRDDLVRCESLDGHVHFIAGRYTIWEPDPGSGRVTTTARDRAWFRTPDDMGFGVGRPRPQRWDGEDFTRPISAPEPTSFLGRPAWQVELAPPPHKPYELTMVVDAVTGLVLRQANDGFGTYAEWTELDTSAELSRDLFEWDDERDVPVAPVADVVRPPHDRADEQIRERLVLLDALVLAAERRDEVCAVIGAAADAGVAAARLTAVFGLSEVQAVSVLDLQLRRLARLERGRLVEQRDELRAMLG